MYDILLKLIHDKMLMRNDSGTQLEANAPGRFTFLPRTHEGLFPRCDGLGHLRTFERCPRPRKINHWTGLSCVTFAIVGVVAQLHDRQYRESHGVRSCRISAEVLKNLDRSKFLP
jgi:hypothetical protein